MCSDTQTICMVHQQCQACSPGVLLTVAQCHQACGTWCLLVALGLVLCIAAQAVAAFYRNFNFTSLKVNVIHYSFISLAQTLPADGLSCACAIALDDQS